MSFKSKYTGKQIENYLDSNKWEYLYNSVGDIVYYDSATNITNSISYTQWNPNLGTPIGIIVVPSGVMGSAKICSLYSTTGHYAITNCIENVQSDYRLENGLIPSDVFTAVDSDDPACKYSREIVEDEVYSNSPWFGRRKSKKFSLPCSHSNNWFWTINNSIWQSVKLNKWDDTPLFNGWYVPSAGEIAFLVSRINIINTAISVLNSYDNKYDLVHPNTMWSLSGWLSTNPDFTYAFVIDVATGEIIRENDVTKEYSCRPFCEWNPAETPAKCFEINIQNLEGNLTTLLVKEGWTWQDLCDFYELESAGNYPNYIPGWQEMEMSDDFAQLSDPVSIKLNGESVQFKDLVQPNVTYTL